MADAAAGTAGSEGVQLSMVPLDNLDLQRMSIIYTTGDMAAVTPLYNYNFHVIAYESAAGSDGGWRELLRWIGYPGFAIALLMALTVAEPRDAGKGGFSVTNPATWKAGTARLSTQLFNTFTGHGWHHSSDKDSSSGSSGVTGAAAVDQQQLLGPACVVDVQQPTPALAVAAAGGGAAAAALALPGTSLAGGGDAAAAGEQGSSEASSSSLAAAAGFMQPIQSLLSIKSFQATTIAAALNDLGSYALIAWHSTFYERVFGLDSGVYAPMLAVILPVGGILGGVGGGLIADYLSVVGGRYWLTAGGRAVLCCAGGWFAVVCIVSALLHSFFLHSAGRGHLGRRRRWAYCGLLVSGWGTLLAYGRWVRLLLCAVACCAVRRFGVEECELHPVSCERLFACSVPHCAAFVC
jgi:hypothetical protein